jgi:phosphoribosyl-ATP pyrophosphohydrolase
MKDVFESLYGVAQSRRDCPREGSYTSYLFDRGLDKILKKVGEECAETIVAAKNGDNAATVSELCDLLYHLVVLMVIQGIGLDEVTAELEARRLKLGNLKAVRETDRNT